MTAINSQALFTMELAPKIICYPKDMHAYKIRGERIRSLREDLGISQVELGKMVARSVSGINQAHISRVEHNAKGFSVEALAACAVALETSIDYLMGLTDDPTKREDMGDQVILTEHDPVRREKLQTLFGLIEKLPPQKRDAYWQMIVTLYTGVKADTSAVHLEKLIQTRPYMR